MKTIHDPDVFVESALKLQEAKVEHFKLLSDPPLQAPSDVIWGSLVLNHYYNCRLWNEEDLVRRNDEPDAVIVANKRAIDRFNQSRNDMVERFDDALFTLLANISPTAQMHSETPGAMFDRLSILTLKVHHMGLQARRNDVSPEHKVQCELRCQMLQQQRTDLSICLCELLKSIQRGEIRFKLYRQFKMYNNPLYLSM